ncbi:MAG: hypothetical protein ACRDO7_11905 [Nocardioidaceae bacterium]
MKRIRVVLAAAAVLAVGACGTHPGSAVVVGDESVSTEVVDDLAGNLCEAVSASGQTDVTGADARQQAASLMLTLTAARQAADDLGVEVPPNDYALTSDEEANLAAQFPDADLAKITTLVEIGKESSAIVAAIGEEQAGSGASDEDLQAAGQQYLQGFIDDADVEVDPRYGLDDTGQAVDTDSLSVSVSESEQEVPASQQCGG